MTDLSAALVFAKIVEHRSFTKAGKTLGLTKATVSRKMQELELRLGARLLQRSTRQLSLTEAGATFYDYCARIAAELEAADSAVGKLQGIPRGRLRLVAPFSFGTTTIASMLPEFMSRFPEIRATLILSNERPDLIKEEFDLAIRVTPTEQLPYPSRLLGVATPRLYAAPAYLSHAGIPRSVAELSNHKTLSLVRWERNGRFAWELAAQGRTEEVQVTPMLVSNSVTAIVQAAVSGLGIALMGNAFFADELAAKKLVPVLPEWAAPPVEVRAIYPSRRGVAPKVRAFIDFLVEKFHFPS